MAMSELDSKFESKVLIVLEIANNHMGDREHGQQLITQLADAVKNYTEIFNFGIKFQFRDLDSFIHPSHKGSSLKYVKRFEETLLSDKDWLLLFETVRTFGFELLATPFDERSVEKCIKHKVDYIKIASCSLADWPLIERIAEVKKPVIFSTAGSNLESIDAMASFFSNRGTDAALMHCVGLYPTPSDSLNIGQISFFKYRYPDMRIGYSTHEDPSLVQTGGLAFALGARIFEKHVGLPNDKYNNNAYSASPEQLVAWLEATRQAIEITGDIQRKTKNSKQEVKSLRDLQRGAFAKRPLKSGERLRDQDVYFAIPSVPGGFTANDFSKYREFAVNTNIEVDEPLTEFNASVSDQRHKIKKIVDKIRGFLSELPVQIPKGAVLEISHHYGIENFFKTGLSMITVVNEEYCKKLLFLLPGQCHPEQYHKKKKETFHVIHGNLELQIDGDSIGLRSGDVQTINQLERHKFYSKSGCVIEEISSTHEGSDSFYSDEQINKNKNRKTLVNFWI